MTDGNRIPGKIVRDDHVPPGKPWSGIVGKGQILRIVDLEGRQGVDFLCYNADDPQERYHMPNTLKAARTLKLGEGHRLYSDVARPIFTIVGDSCGGHDTIGGCCSGPSNEMLYGVRDCPGCRENFLAALGRHGLGRKDIVPNINFFCEVPVTDDRRLADTVFVPGHSRAGDYVDLRAEMNALAVVSNCPQVNNPCNEGRPKPIRIAIWER
jgi:urea carboxylase-associated protein 1